jgi:hypothetical protein
MPIEIPGNIDLSQAERYVLVIRIHPDEYSFSIYNPDDRAAYFYCPVKKNKPAPALRRFQDIYFDEANEFFTFSYRKIYVINYTPAFTYIPSLIFNDKDKSAYMDFLFLENTGKRLHHSLQLPDITIIHSLPEDAYEFVQRSFVNAGIIHHTAPVIAYTQTRSEIINRNKIVLNMQYTGLDVFCFSRDTFLLGNHFHCNDLMDAVYYVLFIWKQLKFDQLNDYLYIAGDPESEEGLMDKLRAYIRHTILAPVALGRSAGLPENRTIPFELNCLSLCEL